MEPDVELAKINRLQMLAACQHGLFTVDQATVIGVSRKALRHAVSSGWLRHVRIGVYAVAGLPPSRWESVMAAALAVGPRAVVSHSSAALIHRFHGIAPAGRELTRAGTAGSRLSGVTVHRSRILRPEDIEMRNGVRVTTPVRTVIDMAG